MPGKTDSIEKQAMINMVKEKGFHVFMGSVRPDSPPAYWDVTMGSFDEFLDVAKKEGTTMMFITYDEVTKDSVEKAGGDEAAKELAGQIENRVGQCGSFLATWMKGDMYFIYMVTTDWWGKILDEYNGNIRNLLAKKQQDPPYS